MSNIGKGSNPSVLSSRTFSLGCFPLVMPTLEFSFSLIHQFSLFAQREMELQRAFVFRVQCCRRADWDSARMIIWCCLGSAHKFFETEFGTAGPLQCFILK